MQLAGQEKRVQTVCLMVLTAIAVGLTLYFLSGVLIPFVLALFFSICLGPIMDFLVQRLRIPRTFAVVGTLLLSSVLLVGIGVLAQTSVQQMLANEDKYSEQLDRLWGQVQDIANTYFGVDLSGEEADDKPGSNISPNNEPTVPETEQATETAPPPTEPLPGVRQRPLGPPKPLDVLIGELFVSVGGSILSIVSQGLIVLVFIFFLLIGRRTHAPTTGLWGEIEKQITGYLTVKVVVSGITGLLVWGILTILNVDLALVFGMFAFILNFIPNVGSVISTLLPLPVVVLAPEAELSTTAKVLAIALPAAVQFGVGNVIEPRLMGKSLDLHPVVILFALIFWGIMWGIIGVFLAVPITASLKILLEKTGFLDPVVSLMAGRPPNMRGGAAGPA